MRHIGKYPADAKIYIDYKKKKVSIDYPVKRTRFKHIYLACIQLWCFIFFYSTLLIGILMFFYTMIFKWKEFFGVIRYKEIVSTDISSGIGILFLFAVSLFSFILFFPPLILTGVYYMFPDYFCTKIPVWNSKLASILMKKYEFTVNKVKYKEVSIPLFTNNTLEYKATKDYSKYLDSIRIEPIKAYTWLFNPKKKKLNTETWCVLFLFSKIPTKGQLYVKYV